MAMLVVLFVIKPAARESIPFPDALGLGLLAALFPTWWALLAVVIAIAGAYAISRTRPPLAATAAALGAVAIGVSL